MLLFLPNLHRWKLQVVDNPSEDSLDSQAAIFASGVPVCPPCSRSLLENTPDHMTEIACPALSCFVRTGGRMSAGDLKDASVRPHACCVHICSWRLQ